jgi:Na+-transporting methylmalonyl-CoA/oxaloacetate decarboxylase gamma subunit
MILATLLPTNPEFADLMKYQFIGLAVVMTALSALALVCGLFGRFFKAMDQKPAKPSIPVMAGTSDIDPIHMAIIAATVATLIKEPHQVVGAQKLTTSTDWNRFMLNTWAVEGRAAIFSSHKIR